MTSKMPAGSRTAADAVWECLACSKLHPPDSGAREFSCADCGVVGLGHADGYSLCYDCAKSRLAEAEPDADVDDEMAGWPLISQIPR